MLGRGCTHQWAEQENKEIASEFTDLIVELSLGTDVLLPILGDGAHSRNGELSVMDMCYTAFMMGRSGVPRQNAEEARCDWFNDTQPLMLAGRDRLLKEAIQRHQYYQADRAARTALHRQHMEDING